MILLFISIGVGCSKRMDDDCDNQVVEPCINGHNQYSTDTFDYVWSDLDGPPSPLGPFFTPDADYFYSHPTINPNNTNQIAYTRYPYDTGIATELWTFDFCTGQNMLLSDEFYYNLDWSSQDWLLFTGGGHQMFKIKSNGDSLTSMSPLGGFNRAGKWNPSGTMTWNRGDDQILYINNEGQTVSDGSPLYPIDWINDSTILGLQSDNLYSYNFMDSSLTLLNNSWTCFSCAKIYNRDDNTCYVTHTFLPGAFTKYSLSGDNQIDTISEEVRSYRYVLGDYSDGKLLMRLDRLRWRDSLGDDRYFKSNLVLMNEDGSNERLVEIPE